MHCLPLLLKHTKNKDLLRSWMPAMDQVLAEVDTYSEVLGPSINLGLETLMVVHQQLHPRHVTVTQSFSPAMSHSPHSQLAPLHRMLLLQEQPPPCHTLHTVNRPHSIACFSYRNNPPPCHTLHTVNRPHSIACFSYRNNVNSR